MLKDFFKLEYDNKKTVIILFLFLFQMLGLRLFPGIGFILCLLLFFLLFRDAKVNVGRLSKMVIIALFASLFQLVKGSSLVYCLLVFIYVVDAILLIYYSESHKLRCDFKAALKIFVIQAFLSVIVYIIVPKSLMFSINSEMLQDKTFLGLFYYITNRDLLPLFSLPRISGWAWEPGCLQLVINLYICLEIFDKANVKSLTIPSIVLLLTGSTAGYVIWAFNMFFFLRTQNLKRFISLIPVICVLLIVALPFMWGIVSKKLSIGTDEVNSSGVVRMRDLFTGIEEVKAYPLFGIDISDLPNSKQYQRLEDLGLNKIGDIGDIWHDSFDYAAGGYCNGFFAMHMFWGIFGLFLLWHFFKCRLWRSWSYGNYWYMFPIIISLALVSEPISNTSLFLFFCMYNLISKRAYDNINNNRYVECG